MGRCLRPIGKRERASEKAPRGLSLKKLGTLPRWRSIAGSPICRPSTARARARPACGLSTCGFTLPGAPLSRSATAPAATGPQHLGGSSRPESIQLHPEPLADIAPLVHVGLDQGAELFGRAACRVHALIDQAALDLGVVERG